MATVPDWMQALVGQKPAGVTYSKPTGIHGGATPVGRKGRTWNPAFMGAKAQGPGVPPWQQGMGQPVPPVQTTTPNVPTIPPPVTPPAVPPVPPVTPPAVPPPAGGVPQYPSGGWSPLQGAVAAANMPGPTSGGNQPVGGGVTVPYSGGGVSYVDPFGVIWFQAPDGSWTTSNPFQTANAGASPGGWGGY